MGWEGIINLWTLSRWSGDVTYQTEHQGDLEELGKSKPLIGWRCYLLSEPYLDDRKELSKYEPYLGYLEESFINLRAIQMI